jgi:hypothetical protein
LIFGIAYKAADVLAVSFRDLYKISRHTHRQVNNNIVADMLAILIERAKEMSILKEWYLI